MLCERFSNPQNQLQKKLPANLDYALRESIMDSERNFMKAISEPFQEPLPLVEEECVYARTEELTPLADRQLQGRLSTHQNSVTLFAVLSKRTGQWRTIRVVDIEPPLESPALA